MGLTTAALALALFASPAFAKKEIEKHFFGEFTASINGQTIDPEHKVTAKGHGSSPREEELALGPVKLRCGGAAPPLKEMTGVATVEAERSPNFTITLKLKKCEAGVKGSSDPKTVFWEPVKWTKPLTFTFHANGSAEVANTLEVEEAAASILIKGTTCPILVPRQTLPLLAERKPEQEFESAEFGTEEETVEGGQIKKFPSGIRERLDIFWELKKIQAKYKPTSKCEYLPEPEGKFNPETGYVEYKNGRFEGELEEIEVKKGELGFDAKKPEV